MARHGTIGFVLMVLLMTYAHVVPAPRESRVVRLDPAFDAIVPGGALIERAAGGFGFAEGLRSLLPGVPAATPGSGRTPQRIRLTSIPHSSQPSAKLSAIRATAAAEAASKGIASAGTGTASAGTMPSRPSR